MRLTSENLAKILHALTIQYGNDLANEIFTNAVEDIINNYLTLTFEVCCSFN